MVGESERAWHAGVGTWHGDSDINSRSIGIEIHNPGHELGYPDFPSAQMQAVIALAHDIVRRSAIPPERVLAHSDIAPDRKIDPGEKFSWSYLAARGIGHWVAPTPVSVRDPGEGPGSTAAAVGTAQRLLAAYGYGVPRTGMLDAPTTAVVAAFQRHFRPERVDGRIDGSTLDTLARLVEALPRA
jgi:N-acetylmuramoyl-L-alanine amidase